MNLAVLIPTLNRSERLPALVESIHKTTIASCNVYLVIEQHDSATERAARNLDCFDVIGEFGSCAAAFNAGFRASDEEVVFLGNDDLEFLPGWDGPAMRMIESGAAVVGVNEGHDRMTCFSMVRRDYVERESGVYDKPGTLVHEYRSQYVDTELAEYAQHRGVWAAAFEGGVIHRHHDFGDADPSHPNYRKAREHLAQDHATFLSRRAEWTAN